MSKIAVFSKFFGYNVGGAERSMLELMKAEELRGHEIVALVNATPRGYGPAMQRLPFPGSWEVREFQLPVNWVRFRFFEYYFNKKTVRRLAKSLQDIDVLYAYGPLAPALINIFPGKTVYLVRDEYGLGWNINYYKGVRGLLQALYHAIEWPLRTLWRQELLRAMRKSRLIANSNFIEGNLRHLAPESEIELLRPQINTAELEKEYRCFKGTVSPLGVVVIGDSVLKGGDIARRVAARLPETIFYVFDRRYTAPQRMNNVFFMPWQAPGAVYAHARVVMVPSRWHEAFGRVVIEAQALGVPVVASNRGGIPEALRDHSRLVHDLNDVDEWARQITSIISERAGGVAS